MPIKKTGARAKHFAGRAATILTGIVFTTLVRLALNPLLGHRATFILYFPVLVFSAWVGGWAGGVATIVVSALASITFFISPNHSLSLTGKSDQISLLIFILVGLSVSALSNSQRKARRQVEESEARKSAVLDVALDCIITTDRGGRILEFNPAAERTFGYTRAEVLGRPIAEVIIPPSLRASHRSGLERYHATGEGPALRRRIELTGMRKDGSEFPVEAAIIPTSGTAGEFASYLRDITERKRQEVERTDLLEQVQSNVVRQRNFLRDVLASVTDGRLALCDTADDLPALPTPFGMPLALSLAGGLRELRQRTREACDAAGFSEERCYDTLTAASEAGMNAVVHVGEGKGQVFLDAERGTVQVRVADTGSGIAVENLPHATLMKGYSSAGTLGHGMKMILQTADRVFLLTGPAGTTLIVEQGRVSPPSAW